MDLTPRVFLPNAPKRGIKKENNPCQNIYKPFTMFQNSLCCVYKTWLFSKRLLFLNKLIRVIGAEGARLLWE
jgi:hypothetical protein